MEGQIKIDENLVCGKKAENIWEDMHKPKNWKT